MIQYINMNRFEYFYRTRLLFQMQNTATKKKYEELCLNEIFIAEKKVSETSIYRMAADRRYVGKFKSSGLIISTGTGSTGWLYSAKRFTSIDVERALAHIGDAKRSQEEYDRLSQILTD